jgi:hypothetical protein
MLSLAGFYGRDPVPHFPFCLLTDRIQPLRQIPLNTPQTAFLFSKPAKFPLFN